MMATGILEAFKASGGTQTQIDTAKVNALDASRQGTVIGGSPGQGQEAPATQRIAVKPPVMHLAKEAGVSIPSKPQGLLGAFKDAGGTNAQITAAKKAANTGQIRSFSTGQPTGKTYDKINLNQIYGATGKAKGTALGNRVSDQQNLDLWHQKNPHDSAQSAATGQMTGAQAGAPGSAGPQSLADAFSTPATPTPSSE